MTNKIEKRGPGGLFAKGNTMGGRRKGYKGLARDIQNMSGSGIELVEFMFAVLRGEVPEGASLGAKQWACEQLLNRGYGKAPQVIEISQSLDSDATASVIDVAGMSDEELEVWEKAAEIASRHANKRKPIDV